MNNVLPPAKLDYGGSVSAKRISAATTFSLVAIVSTRRLAARLALLGRVGGDLAGCRCHRLEISRAAGTQRRQLGIETWRRDRLAVQPIAQAAKRARIPVRRAFALLRACADTLLDLHDWRSAAQRVPVWAIG